MTHCSGYHLYFIALSIVLLMAGTTEEVRAASGSVPSQVQSADGLSDSAIDQAAEKILNGNEFRSVRRRVLENLPDEPSNEDSFLIRSLQWLGDLISSGFRKIGDFFEWMFSGLRGGTSAPATSPSPSSDTGSLFGSLGSAFAQLVTIVAIVAIVAILAVIIALLVRSFERKRRKDGLLDDGEDLLSDVLVPPGELAASTYETRAMQLASAGDYRGAIRELLLGSMSWIERAGLIRYRRGLTNRDYARAVWRRGEKRQAYQATASRFELVYFGRRLPTPEMFEECLTNFRGAFREEETPTAAV